MHLTRNLALLLAVIIVVLKCSITFCETHTYKSYQNSVYCSASTAVQYPEYVEQMQKLIRDAIEDGQTVKILGSRHSTTDVICTSGVPISAKNINYMYFPDQTKETVKVGAGAELRKVLEFLELHERSLIHMPTYGGITIGGAIGVGAHGSSLRHPTAISDQVVGVTIIDGNGDIQKIDDLEELKAFRVHLGLLGALIDVTLNTVPLVKMKMYNYAEHETILLSGKVLEMAKTRDWFQLWWFPFSEYVVISEGNYSSPLVSSRLVGNAETNFIPNYTPDQIHVLREGLEGMQATKNFAFEYAVEDYTKHSFYQPVIGKPFIFSEKDENGTDKFVNPAIGWAHRLQSNRCWNKCAWANGEADSLFPEEYSFALPLNHLPRAAQKIKQILQTLPAAFPLVGIFIRFAKRSDAYMSIGAERDTVVIDWATPMRSDPFENSKYGLGTYQAMSQALIFQFGGRPHWGKNGQEFFTRQIIQRRPVELLDKFRNIMEKYDPNGVFTNHFGKRVQLITDILTVPPEVSRCALQDYCTCRKDGDCASEQNCGTALEEYTVCMDEVQPLPVIPDETDYDPLNITDIVRYFMSNGKGNKTGSIQLR